MTRPVFARGTGTSPAGPAGRDGKNGLPGVNAIPAKDAVDAYNAALLADADSATTAAVSTSIGGRTGFEVSISDYASLAAAVTALPSTGGTVLVTDGRWLLGDFSTALVKPNVRIIGSRMPRPTANTDRLTGGAVLECNVSGFASYAHGLHVENVGFDFGKYVSDTYWSSNPQTSGEWTAFSHAYPGQSGTARNDVQINNVIGLLRSPSSVGHAVLMEAINGGAADNIIGIGGTHGIAIKSTNFKVGRLGGYCSSSNHIIIKADSYAPCGNVTIDQTDSDNVPLYGTPHFTPVQAARGVYVEAFGANMGEVSIGQVNARGAASLYCTGNASAFTIVRAVVGILNASGGGAALQVYQQAVLDLSIGDFRARDCIQGILADSDSASSTRLVHIEKAVITGTTGGGGNLAIGLSAYARVKIDALAVRSNNAYQIANTARLFVGASDVIANTTKFVGSAPAVGGWANTGGSESTFQIDLENYGVTARGTLTAAGTSGVVATMPAYLRPPTNTRGTGRLTGASCGLGAYVDGTVSVNEGAAVTSGAQVSIDGFAWPLAA